MDSIISKHRHRLFEVVVLVSRRDFVLPHLEWEVFNEPVSITTVVEQERLPKGQTCILVNRDENYNLRAVMKFKDPSFDRVSGKSKDILGSFAELFDIQGSDSKSLSYTLESAVFGDIEHEISAETGFSGTATIHFGGLRVKTGNNNKGTHLTEWFLNGPKDHVFSRITNRRVFRAFSRERIESRDSKLDHIETSLEAPKSTEDPFKIFDYVDTPFETSSKRVDFLKIKTDNLQFLVEKVPDGIGPNWSSNLAIEYRKTWGGIPDVAEREEILEVCSFVFGRQLLQIGYTLYDQNENVVEAYARDPWGRTAKSFCSKPDYPPVNIEAIPSLHKAETIISKLLPKYCELGEPLCFKEALWNYWISRQMPLGTNLPILAAGVESIINRWFHCSKSKSKGLYLDKEEFGKLLGDEIQRIGKKLEGTPYGKKITGKILRANEFGMIDNYRKFFEEINLPISEKECQALTGRHKFVHGGALFDKTDWKKVAQQSNTFETLFNKILLKLLDYSGTFVDRSTVGWPEVQLN